MVGAEFDYKAMADKVVDALRKEFPQDTIATEEGYKGRVRVKLVSEKFNGMTEREKQDIVWGILVHYLKEDSQAVSIALAYGTDEL